MEWVKCRDRLPGERKWVLIFYKGIIDKKLFEENTFYDGEINYYCPSGKIENVSHWMPLPEPPKEDDKCIQDL